MNLSCDYFVDDTAFQVEILIASLKVSGQGRREMLICEACMIVFSWTCSRCFCYRQPSEADRDFTSSEH